MISAGVFNNFKNKGVNMKPIIENSIPPTGEMIIDVSIDFFNLS